jgi:peptide methionine sulfoxide reductase MsrA
MLERGSAISLRGGAAGQRGGASGQDEYRDVLYKYATAAAMCVVSFDFSTYEYAPLMMFLWAIEMPSIVEEAMS